MMIDAVPGRDKLDMVCPGPSRRIFNTMQRILWIFALPDEAKLFVEEPAAGGEQEAQVTNASATNNLDSVDRRSSCRKLEFLL